MNNTVLRTISGIGFIIVMLAGLLIDKYIFAALVIFIMVVMMHEFYTITMGDRYRFSRMLAMLSGITLFILIFGLCAFGWQTKYLALAMLPVIVVTMNSLYVRDKSEFGKFSDIYTGILYIAVPLSLSNLIVFFNNEFNGLVLLCFFIIIWSSDIGAYIFGITLGQKYGKKLCPDISPKKSWVGFWGGMLCAILASIIMKYALNLNMPIIHSILLAVIMDVAGVYGDLFESQWKRYYNVKDSGTIIPGHGGLLDRFDSTLMAMPAGAMYLILINVL